MNPKKSQKKKIPLRGPDLVCRRGYKEGHKKTERRGFRGGGRNPSERSSLSRKGWGPQTSNAESYAELFLHRPKEIKGRTSVGVGAKSGG